MEFTFSPERLDRDRQILELAGFQTEEIVSLLWLRMHCAEYADIDNINSGFQFGRWLLEHSRISDYGAGAHPQDESGNWTIKPEWKDKDPNKGQKKK